MTALTEWENFTGIHNAWDTVTHLVFVVKPEKREASQTAFN